MKTENVQIEIRTEREEDGSYSYSFELNGNFYNDWDFTSRKAALEEARSIAREAFHAFSM